MPNDAVLLKEVDSVVLWESDCVGVSGEFVFDRSLVCVTEAVAIIVSDIAEGETVSEDVLEPGS